MPEAVTTVVTTPAAPNGVAKPAAPAPAPVPAAADVAAKRDADLKAREDSIAAREKKFQNELRKNAEEKSGIGAKLKERDELQRQRDEVQKERDELKAWRAEREKQERLEELNPVSAMEKRFGKDWHKRANELAVSGVAPADMQAETLMRMEERLRKELDERDEKARGAAEKSRLEARQQQERQIEAMRRELAAEASEFASKSAADYPIFETLGSPAQVGALLSQRIELASQNGAEMSYKEAADGLEADLLKITEKAVSAEKYRENLQAKFKPATVAESSGVQGAPSSTRRTLSNHLTASTSDRPPPKTEAERRQRANEAFDSVIAAKRSKS